MNCCGVVGSCGRGEGGLEVLVGGCGPEGLPGLGETGRVGFPTKQMSGGGGKGERSHGNERGGDGVRSALSGELGGVWVRGLRGEGERGRIIRSPSWSGLPNCVFGTSGFRSLTVDVVDLVSALIVQVDG